MKAVEFEATAENNILRLPDEIPDGKKLRILLLFDEDEAGAGSEDIKMQLLNLTEGLNSNDLKRDEDTGREVPEWLS